MDKIKEMISPVFFPNTKLALKFKDFSVIIDSSVHGICEIEHDSENVYLTIKRKDAMEFKLNF